MISDIEDSVDMNGRLINKILAYRNILNVEVAIQLDEKVVAGQVKRKVLGIEVKIVGRYDTNPMMSSMIYEVEFLDRPVKYYVENAIAENILSQVDDKGCSVTLVGLIVYHERDDSAVDNSNTYAVPRRVQRRLRKTAQYWKLLVSWEDGSETWIPLKDTKE